MMLLRARTLAMGWSGTRPVVAQRLLELLNAGLTPVVPEYGSLGASGDLAPMAHCALALIGEGEVDCVDGLRRPAGEALAGAGIEPVTLGPKEGLALINGTDGMLAMLVLAFDDLARVLRVADITAAMSVEALMGTDRAFAADLLELRPQPGQAASAANLRALLADSEIVASHREGDPRVQDAYSLRCAPQVAGAARDTLGYAETVATAELRAAIDNPMVLPDGRVESCGNFHGAPVAYVCDFLAIAAADVGAIAERRTDRLLDATRSHGLPPFLAEDPGVNSGLMLAHYSQAAMVAENRRLAAPASVDSLPTSAMQEDHVSMGWGAARKLRAAIANLARILAVELTCAARGLDLRAPLRPAPGTAAALAAVRSRIEGPGADRYVAPELAAAEALVGSGEVLDAVESRHGSTPMSAGTEVHAPRGNEISCRGWPQEAALRMLMNNLDPEVAENPAELVVYGGTGRRRARGRPSTRSCATLRGLADDETLLVQSGKPVGVFRTHEWAPRVLIANSNLVPEWATWEEFRRLEALGLTMYGQMTAGSWIYIGSQGIVQGTYECFAEIARRRHGGSLAGTITLTAGLGGMGGAQPLAVTMNGGVGAVRRGRSVTGSSAGCETRYLDEVADSLDDAVARCAPRPSASGEPLSVGLVGNAADVLPALLARGFQADIVTDQTSAHDPLNGYVPEPDVARRGRRAAASPTPTSTSSARARRSPPSARRWSASSTRGSEVFDYGNSLRAEASDSAASSARSPTPGSCPAYIRPLFCEGKGPFRWVALSGDPADIAATDRAVLEEFPDDEPLARWIPHASRADRVPGAAGADLLARLRRAPPRSGCASTRWCAPASVSAPIVIGRDHLDSGSVASPYRETEAMADESDAIADWPLLNALVNTAAGATWVSIHHGGGVGIGRSIHAGMVCVADGTDARGREARPGADHAIPAPA